MKKREKTQDLEKETKQKRPFKKKRANQVLTEEQVKEIKAGRKKLRKQMKQAKVYNRKEFELTASSMGLYFDKNKWWGLLLWLFHGRTLKALLAAAATLLTVLLISSLVSQLKGHFTINLSDEMLRNGFILSEDAAFTDPKAILYSDPVENAPCISISTIPEDIDDYDGPHNGEDYFAYTFYIRNEGEDTVNYEYELAINSESQNLSSATWVMLFKDGEMMLYAEASEDGDAEALPSFGDNTRGYRIAPFIDQAANPEKQYQAIATTSRGTYYRIIPQSFETDSIIASGYHESMEPMEVHKYTVVIWLEGDDPDCTDDLIGGNIGAEMNFRLLDIEADQ